jgi:hypothetical protein
MSTTNGLSLKPKKARRVAVQTKLHSAIESTVNILIGYLVALGSQIVIFPFFGIQVGLRDNLLIGFWFTIISLVRSYALRRAFNKVTVQSHSEGMNK